MVAWGQGGRADELAALQGYLSETVSKEECTRPQNTLCQISSSSLSTCLGLHGGICFGDALQGCLALSMSLWKFCVWGSLQGCLAPSVSLQVFVFGGTLQGCLALSTSLWAFVFWGILQGCLSLSMSL